MDDIAQPLLASNMMRRLGVLRPMQYKLLDSNMHAKWCCLHCLLLQTSDLSACMSHVLVLKAKAECAVDLVKAILQE